MTFWKTLLGAIALPLLTASAIAEKQPATPATTAGAPSSNAPAAKANTAAEEDDIRDVRPPVPIPYSWLWLAYSAAGCLVLVALVLLARWLLRPRPVKPVPAHEIALARLERAKPLMAPEHAREYSFAVSEILREYIENRFHERAARRTTEEFLRDLLSSSNAALAAHRDLLDEVLRYCDLAKFARWELSNADMMAMYDSARAFILVTRPAVSEPAPTTPIPPPLPSSSP